MLNYFAVVLAALCISPPGAGRTDLFLIVSGRSAERGIIAAPT